MKTMNLTLMLLFFAVVSFAQNVPAYVPTNGLVGWWPFNGNANDESGNGNNGTVNGATLTSDRFGNAGSCMLFNSNSSQYISSNIGIQDTLTFSFWFNCNTQSRYYPSFIDYGSASSSSINERYQINMAGLEPSWVNTITGRIYTQTNLQGSQIFDNNITSNSQWNYAVSIFVPNDSIYLYVNGLKKASIQLGNTIINNGTLFFGRDITDNNGACAGCGRYNGKIDDICIWNRVLTQQEITNLYNGGICYQTITVTDTLLINTNITGFNPITYENTIRIYPNPSNDHITIDAGNLNVMSGYSIRISNSLGQQMFQSAITQQQFYIDLSTWTGNGIYFVNIIDPTGNIIDVKKIVLQ